MNIFCLCPLAKVLHSPTKLCAVSQNVCTLSQNEFPEKLSHAKHLLTLTKLQVCLSSKTKYVNFTSFNIFHVLLLLK